MEKSFNGAQYCESHDDRVFLEPERVLRELRTRDEVECS